MPPQYIFPCTNCDHQFHLVTKQAGQDLKCPQCQHHMEAPMLGKMKQLKMVGGTEPELRKPKPSGRLRNGLFVVGLATAILCGIGGTLLYTYANGMIFKVDSNVMSEQFDQDVDTLNAPEVVELYEIMSIEKGLGEWYEPNYVRYNTQGAILINFAYGFLGLAGFGGLLLLSSFLVKR